MGVLRVEARKRARLPAVVSRVVLLGVLSASFAWGLCASSVRAAEDYPRGWYPLSKGGLPPSRSGVADGTPATTVALDPRALSAEADGGLLVAGDNQVVRVDMSGRITRLAGTGGPPEPSAGTPALGAALWGASAVAALPGGAFLVGTDHDPAIRAVDPSGNLRVVAGDGTYGDSGNGGPAQQAKFDAPHGIIALPDGSFVFTDNVNGRVRRVTADGTITLVAGNGHYGFRGDSGTAITAKLSAPDGLAVLADGSVLIADTGNQRIRRVDTSGVISTVAGTGKPADLGDGGRASRAAVSEPRALLATSDRGFLIGGSGLRKVSAQGKISTVASGDAWDFAGRQVGPLRALARLPDGSLAAISGQGVAMLASAHPQRLAVAIRDLKVSRSTVTVTIDATRSASVRLEIRNGTDVRSGVTASLSPGKNVVPARGSFAPQPYEVRLTAADSNGRVAGDHVVAYLGDRLTLHAAEAKVENALRGFGSSEATDYLKGCRRIGGRQRVDCQVRFSAYNPNDTTQSVDRCVTILSIRRAPTGILNVAQYRCPRRGEARFRESPKLAYPPQPFDVAPINYGCFCVHRR
ncbi:MAG: hypothetical protein QOH61_2439 [Chloroflexota bacterium]|jgi:hypothetical protein|nr:hypothetical protein [Chloroflexota bacterium]